LLWEPGEVLIVEGLDATGKSTLIKHLLNRVWEDPTPRVIHQPSGLLPLTHRIYELTETEQIDEPLTRQLLHLSCHAANLPLIRRERSHRGLVLDRWWWSTVAYGFFGAKLSTRISRQQYDAMVNAVWGDFEADLIVVLLEPRRADPRNVELLVKGYRDLINRSPIPVLQLPAVAPDAAVDLVLERLRQAGIVEGAEAQ
jgi:thymidylate kinase